MIDEKTVAKEVVKLETLRTLARVYGEIASIRLKRTRDSVLTSRSFLEEVNVVFAEVQANFAQQVSELAKKRGYKGKERITFLAHNGKTVAVLFSANTRLYGDIVSRTFDLFLEDVRNHSSEAAIVGRVGLSLFLEEEPNRPYSFFEFPDDKVNHDELIKIIQHLVQYEEIHIYYGKFQNLVSQVPTMHSVTTEISKVENTKAPVVRYLFEPSLEEVLQFFEKEIFVTLIEQTMRESQLAKFASRLLAMDRAEQNIGKEVDKMQLTRLKVSHRTANRKQLDTLTSVLGRLGR